MNQSALNKLRVLFVDDEAPIRDVMRIELPRMGHETCICEDGQAALAAIDKNTFDAKFTRSVLGEVRSATVVDLSLADDLKTTPGVRALEGLLPGTLEAIADASIDVVVCNSVLEHLWEPEKAIAQMRRILRPGGVCFLNVPSWLGKVVLETAAFKLHITSAEEINDHKAYYDRRAFWSLVVRSGWKPSQVACHSHKFGLNTYAVCTLK